jgi:hypothetical protein
VSNFSDVLGNLEGGRTFAELNDQLQDVVTAVMEHNKPGEITVVLKISPNGQHAVSVAAAIKSKAPEANRGVTTFYADGAGNLLRRDPRQPELPLRDIAEPPRGELRNA